VEHHHSDLQHQLVQQEGLVVVPAHLLPLALVVVLDLVVL
jgi:hypothetical protein